MKLFLRYGESGVYLLCLFKGEKRRRQRWEREREWGRKLDQSGKWISLSLNHYSLGIFGQDGATINIIFSFLFGEEILEQILETK